MSKDFQLGKYFRLVVGNDWHFISTPSVQVTLNDWSDSTGMTLRVLGAWLSVIYYPNGDSRSNMFSYEFYEEDYNEDDCGECECEDDEQELTNENVALRDVVG